MYLNSGHISGIRRDVELMYNRKNHSEQWEKICMVQTIYMCHHGHQSQTLQKKQTAANHVLKVTQTTGSAHHFFITYAGSTDIMQQTVVQMV